MQLIDGKAVAAEVKGRIKSEVEAMRERGERAPGLVAILVGDDGASRTYVAAKEKACEALGFYSEVLRLPATTTQQELLCEVERLNGDDRVDGFIVQMPLPRHIDDQKIIEAIDPRKDVDGFHPVNVGKVSLGLRPAFVSATPAGVMELLKHYNIETSGKSCVVIGRSNIVGRPMSILMSEKGVDCTVTLVHSRTVGIEKICRESDIIIAALGIAEFLKGDMVKEGAVVIDVGITRVEDASKKNGFRLLGDVNWAEVSPKCSYITPVPGGVGPMTIVSLMLNTLLARQLNK